LFEKITPALLDLGLAILWTNTRGHDGVYPAVATNRGRLGAGYETVDECRYDIAAWVDLLVERGYRRVGLLGHSLGAIKAIYSHVQQPHPAVECIIAASPPRLSYSCFNNGERSEVFFESICEAERHVSEGRGKTLMEVQFPFPLLITAESYVDKYGREERYNIVKFVEQIDCPTLFTYGQLELEQGGVAFAGVPDALRANLTEPQRVVITTIPDADHLYTGVQESLAAHIASWLKALASSVR
ncbi:MAG: hypothetical protein IH991_13490, partial [Planctomycetes bacterium]|nr:hypothetical protein [Planctomycetota bacterium]